MSTNRILILMVIFIAMLYAVSTAVGLHQSTTGGWNSTTLRDSWISSLTKPKPVDLATVTVTFSTVDTKTKIWTIPTGTTTAVLHLPEGSRFSASVRQLKVTLLSSTPAKAEYAPAAEKDGSFSDPEARPRADDLLPAGKLDLAVLRHGGSITVIRKPATKGPILLKLE